MELCDDNLTRDQKDRMKMFGVPQEHLDWANKNYISKDGEKLFRQISRYNWAVFSLILVLAGIAPFSRYWLAKQTPGILLYQPFQTLDVIVMAVGFCVAIVVQRAYRFWLASRLNSKERRLVAIRMFAGPKSTPKDKQGRKQFRFVTAFLSKMLFALSAKQRDFGSNFFDNIVETRSRQWGLMSIPSAIIMSIAVFGASISSAQLTETEVVIRPNFWPLREEIRLEHSAIQSVETGCHYSNGGRNTGARSSPIYRIRVDSRRNLNLVHWWTVSGNTSEHLLTLDTELRQKNTHFWRSEWDRQCVSRYSERSHWSDILHMDENLPRRR